MNFKQKLIAITLPTVLALGLGAAAAQAASNPKASQSRIEQESPKPQPAPAVDKTAPVVTKKDAKTANQNSGTQAEAEKNDGEQNEGAEGPEGPDAQKGHQDAAGDQNHEFEGEE